ncbi:NAD(P)H-binding protein [Streptomyces sp. NPDC056544]|uniref:NAD(P)H-binding protein n=1 Tax=unclassified Streptomyces TaxID=2593676 RepID=UPI0036A0CB22
MAASGTRWTVAAMAASGTRWTVVRPPVLQDKPHTGTYRRTFGANVRGGRVIPRADVADASRPS